MSVVDVHTARAWMTEAARLVSEQADHLIELDAAIGDGDHGTNLRRGFAAGMEALSSSEATTPGVVLTTVGKAVIAKTGGAAGPLYGSALRRAGQTLGEVSQVDPAGLADALRAALVAVQQLGRADEGDKTMIDALAPAVRAYGEAVDAGTDLGGATRAAADAAARGARATVPLQARKGRASYLGQRSVGHEDPGAASSALIMRALEIVTGGTGTIAQA